MESFVRNLVRTLLETEEEFDDDMSLSMLGLDSIKTIQIIVEIEEHYQIVFEDEILKPENFSSLRKIVEMTRKCLSQGEEEPIPYGISD
jgi:acyl carrier protein